MFKKFTIRGPGLLRATQEAHATRAQLVIAKDSNAAGDIIRIGYFLEKEGNVAGDPQITWFGHDEIEIVHVASCKIPPIHQARLEVEHSSTKTPQRTFMIEIPLGADFDLSFRNVFRLKREKVKDFVIQVEIKQRRSGAPNKIYPIVRYDCAHGSIHCDLMVPKGSKTKRYLPTQMIKEAISFAIEDLAVNLSDWLKDLNHSSITPGMINYQELKQDLARAKTDLIRLSENPDFMLATSSRLTQYR